MMADHLARAPRALLSPAFRGLSLLTISGFLTGCTSLAHRLSPEVEETPLPASFLHAQAVGEDLPDQPPRSASPWKVFRDPLLDRLLEALPVAAEGTQGNPDLAAALARVERSRAVWGQSRSQRWPGLLGDASFRDRRDSLNDQLFATDQREYDRYGLGASASWEIDFWGRIRETARRDGLLAEGQQALYEAAVLSMESQVARQYFAWRTLDEELAILQEAIRIREADLNLEKARLDLGSGIEVDVARSKVALNNARAAAEATQRAKRKLEHSLAVLLGQAPKDFHLLPRDPRDLAALTAPPAMPQALPVPWLRARPDLRASEHQLRAAALDVGIRKVSFLPRLSLTGSGGWSSLRTADLFNPGSSWFDLGPELAVPLFQAGRNVQATSEAKAAWREAEATYRSQLLTALREVDDALLDLQSLERELTLQQEAVKAASETSSIARLRHERGLTSFFEVVEAERDRLTARRGANTLLGERYAASVALIQAIGGAWSDR